MNLRRLPHLQVGEVVIRHDIGDELARQHGSPMVGTACGLQIMATLTTRRKDLVRCPACQEGSAK